MNACSEYTHTYPRPLVQCECKGTCGKPSFKGDGHCDDENNNAACAYDGGDCCGAKVHKGYCVKVSLQAK